MDYTGCAFKLMKPVRGIETFIGLNHAPSGITFQINETRSRD